MPRSIALLVIVVMCAAGACGFAPAAPGSAGAAANGGPLGAGANGGGLVGGGTAAQSGQANNTGMNCAEVPQPLNKLPPDILIVLDKSGSMNDSADGTCTGNCGANSKWTQTVAALTTVISQTDTTVNWGLKFFASPNGGMCGVNQGADVAIAANNATAVNNAINGQTPGNSTPTRTAVANGAAYLGTVNQPNPKFLLLATDGLPNCTPGCSGNTACSASDMTGAVNAVMTAATAGFPTFVVGIATTSDPMSDATLTQMANAGGYPRAGTPSYYPVMNQADLVAALNQIVVIAGTCIFAIPTPPNNDTDAMHIGVKVDGTEIGRDTTHMNGWDYSGTSQVEIFGPSCQAIMAGTVQSVQIVFKCIIN